MQKYTFENRFKISKNYYHYLRKTFSPFKTELEFVSDKINLVHFKTGFLTIKHSLDVIFIKYIFFPRQ